MKVKYSFRILFQAEGASGSGTSVTRTRARTTAAARSTTTTWGSAATASPDFWADFASRTSTCRKTAPLREDTEKGELLPPNLSFGAAELFYLI